VTSSSKAVFPSHSFKNIPKQTSMSSKLKKIFNQSDKVDSKSFQFLVNALEKKSTDEFDYLKFKQSLIAMQGLNLDSETAYKSAFFTASTMGLTKDKLLKTAKFYRQNLSQEKEEFEKALEKQISDRIESRKQENAQLLAIIEQCEEQIKKLQEKIKECNDRIKSTDKDIKDAESRILGSKEKFINAYNEISNEIDSDLEMIQTSL